MGKYTMTGKNNPIHNINQKRMNNFNWKGGTSFEPYGEEFNRELKEQIRKRDNYICQYCNIKQSRKNFPIHHIDYNKKNNKPENLITLCGKCHSKSNGKRLYWKSFLSWKMETRLA